MTGNVTIKQAESAYLLTCEVIGRLNLVLNSWKSNENNQLKEGYHGKYAFFVG